MRMAAQTFSVFVTGGTGYIGTPLIRALVERGHSVRALVRPGSEKKLPAARRSSLRQRAGFFLVRSTHSSVHTFVQLVGVAHPSPSKAAEFRAIDRESALGAIFAARLPESSISFTSVWHSLRR